MGTTLYTDTVNIEMEQVKYENYISQCNFLLVISMYLKIMY